MGARGANPHGVECPHITAKEGHCEPFLQVEDGPLKCHRPQEQMAIHHVGKGMIK